MSLSYTPVGVNKIVYVLYKTKCFAYVYQTLVMCPMLYRYYPISLLYSVILLFHCIVCVYITHCTHIFNHCLISILNKEDKVVDYYQKMQQSPSMHQFKKILHVSYLDELLKFSPWHKSKQENFLLHLPLVTVASGCAHSNTSYFYVFFFSRMNVL
jgi:hypothetical protein